MFVFCTHVVSGLLLHQSDIFKHVCFEQGGSMLIEISASPWSSSSCTKSSWPLSWKRSGSQLFTDSPTAHPLQRLRKLTRRKQTSRHLHVSSQFYSDYLWPCKLSDDLQVRVIHVVFPCNVQGCLPIDSQTVWIHSCFQQQSDNDGVTYLRCHMQWHQQVGSNWLVARSTIAENSWRFQVSEAMPNTAPSEGVDIQIYIYIYVYGAIYIFIHTVIIMDLYIYNIYISLYICIISLIT